MIDNVSAKKCVVTGAAGFIGSHLARRLLDEGRRVVLIDDFTRGNRLNLIDLGIECECHNVDLTNYDKLIELMDEADTVFHFAARVGSVEYLHGSNVAELLTLQTNLIIDTNVIKACLKKNVKKIIYASSISVYPVETQHYLNAVFSEDDIHPLNPEGGYGWAKYLAEVELGLISNVDIGIARIFNIYGENAALGKTAQVIPALICKAIAYPKEEFVVWGSGEQTRDFLYVADCVEALLRLEKKVSNPPTIVNIGSGQAVPIKTIVEKIVRISGKNPKLRFDTSKPVGPVSRTSDISRARSILGWKPETSLDTGLGRTYAYVEKRLGKHST